MERVNKVIKTILSNYATSDYRTKDEHLHEIECVIRIFLLKEDYIKNGISDVEGDTQESIQTSNESDEVQGSPSYFRATKVESVVNIIYVCAKRLLTLIRWYGSITMFYCTAPNIFCLNCYQRLLNPIILKN